MEPFASSDSPSDPSSDSPPSTPTARSRHTLPNALPNAPPILQHPGVTAMNSLIRALLNLQDAAYGACDVLATRNGTEKKQ